MKAISILLALIIVLQGGWISQVEIELPMDSECLDGYWEEGYDYYLQIEDGSMILRDYAKKIVLETPFEITYGQDGIDGMIPENPYLKYDESDPYAEISCMMYADGDIYMTERSLIFPDQFDTYCLHPVDHDPFYDLIIRDDELLDMLQGDWVDDSGESACYLCIEGNHIRMFWEDYPKYNLLDADFHAISYRNDASRQIYLVNDDLVQLDFFGFSAFTLRDGILSTYEIVYDVDLPPYEFRKVDGNPFVMEEVPVCYKPVIYLYPEEETRAEVTLSLDGEITCAYPAYENGWRVTASPDGMLTDDSGQTYNYLFWEGETGAEYDLSEGFCVPGEETGAFLEDALQKLGLTRREANEFIVFWLPKMQNNAYNLITFNPEAYFTAAKLTVSPEPETVIRVFMAWKASDERTEIPPQILEAPERKGFTVVEWGGTEILG